MYIQFYVRVEYHFLEIPKYTQMAVSYDESEALFSKWVVHILDYIEDGGRISVQRDSYVVPNTHHRHKTYTFLNGKTILAKVMLIPSLSSGEPDTESITGGLL